MPSLKSLRNRISSVKSTQKITKAMKMVAAAKLRRAQSQAEAAQPYATRMASMMAALAKGAAGNPNAPTLLVGNGATQRHLIVAVTADRGLAGPFNASISRAAKARVRALQAEGKSVQLFAVGRKGRDSFRRDMADIMMGDVNFVGKKTVEFKDAEAIADRIIAGFNDGKFDVCTLMFNKFVSVMVQNVAETPLIPAAGTTIANDNQRPESDPTKPDPTKSDPTKTDPSGTDDYEIEPDDGSLLDRLLPRNLAVQIYRALLESSAGFYASQMTAMDGASRNAGDMINRLTMNYNRTRQANITRELIEIISGAEAL